MGRRSLAAAVGAAVLALAACAAPAATRVADGVAAPPTASASRIESGMVDSAALGRPMPFTAYLPAGYDSDPKRSYPVVYLLHGMDGSDRQWLDLGAAGAADEVIAAGAQPFLIVMPEGERGYWMDQADGGPRWGSYVADDVIRAVDQRYRTVARREGRAIGGLSMGAHGALQLSMNHPDVFSVVGAHSPALRQQSQAMPYFGRGADYAARDPISLVAARPDVARRFSIWVDVGDHDRWAPGAELLHHEMSELGVPHRWHESSGEHAAAYWSAHLREYLRYYASALAAER